jgi:ribosomal protein L7Ae-like RNA K-turn-binding protein
MCCKKNTNNKKISKKKTLKKSFGIKTAYKSTAIFDYQMGKKTHCFRSGIAGDK